MFKKVKEKLEHKKKIEYYRNVQNDLKKNQMKLLYMKTIKIENFFKWIKWNIWYSQRINEDGMDIPIN